MTKRQFVLIIHGRPKSIYETSNEAFYIWFKDKNRNNPRNVTIQEIVDNEFVDYADIYENEINVGTGHTVFEYGLIFTGHIEETNISAETDETFVVIETEVKKN